MPGIVTPLFLVDDADVFVYASVEDAERDIEPLDVQPGGLVAYGAEGRFVRLGTEGKTVLLQLAEDEPTHAAELEAALREHLRWRKEPAADDPACDLPCLVNACRRFISSPPTVGDFLGWVRRAARGIFRGSRVRGL